MADFTRDQLLSKVRRREKIERADLRGIVLSGTVLAGAGLRRSDLEGADLEKAILHGADLRSADLREAYLVAADLKEANLEKAELEGAKLDRADLSGANLTRANLEGASLIGAKLVGASLDFAQLESAKLGGADLKGASLVHADLEEAYAGGARFEACDLTSANLAGANLEEANFRQARLNDANLARASAVACVFADASLVRANLSGAVLKGADIAGGDLRQANLKGASLEGAQLTGARIAGMIGTGNELGHLEVEWVDNSRDGDGSAKLTDGEIPALLAGREAKPTKTQVAPNTRYFGRGDVMRGATLQFESSVRVEADSVFEDCTLELGEGTELIVGKRGVLSDCTIRGHGRVTIHGKFFERESPGIIGPQHLVVTTGGCVVADVEQAAASTFVFERGCSLRMKIRKPRSRSSKKGKRS